MQAKHSDGQLRPALVEAYSGGARLRQRMPEGGRILEVLVSQPVCMQTTQELCFGVHDSSAVEGAAPPSLLNLDDYFGDRGAANLLTD